MTTPLRQLLVLSFALASSSLVWSSSARAVPTVPGSSEATVACLGVSEFTGVLGFVTESCSETGSNVNGSGNAEALATTGGGLAPFASADAQSDATASGVGFGVFSARGDANAQLYYQMAVSISATPPTTLSSIPVTISALGMVDATGSGSGGGNATASLTFGPSATPILFSQVQASVPGGPASDSFLWGQTFSLQTALAYDIRMVADASTQAAVGAQAGGATFGDGTANAFVDPHFNFDQAAFDVFATQQGFATFQLDEYFQFEFTLVPEPTSMALAFIGSLGLAFRLRR